MRRLNRVEYQNTMFDLLGVENGLRARFASLMLFLPMGSKTMVDRCRCRRSSSNTIWRRQRRALEKAIVSGVQPKPFDYTFTESKSMVGWRLRTLQLLGRPQQFLVKMVDQYPDEGDFVVRVRLSLN